MEHREFVLSLSYGKDSLACLGAIKELGWPLTRIVHAEVWATDDIPADLPPMVTFKRNADKIIKDRYGIDVEHVHSGKTFESVFYSVFRKSKTRNGQIYGFPFPGRNWCNSMLKIAAIKAAKSSARNSIQYIGIAADEQNRFHNLSETKKSPLVEAGWTEADCRKWCEDNDLLSPIYTTTTRGGCWFCPNQSISQLRLLRRDYPDLFALLLKWDADSPVKFSPKHTVHDYDRRFSLEDDGLINPGERFRWTMIDEPLNYRLF